jgi:hypothetical protein
MSAPEAQFPLQRVPARSAPILRSWLARDAAQIEQLRAKRVI